MSSYLDHIFKTGIIEFPQEMTEYVYPEERAIIDRRPCAHNGDHPSIQCPQDHYAIVLKLRQLLGESYRVYWGVLEDQFVNYTNIFVHRVSRDGDNASESQLQWFIAAMLVHSKDSVGIMSVNILTDPDSPDPIYSSFDVVAGLERLFDDAVIAATSGWQFGYDEDERDADYWVDAY
jgi:hypothetical protein